MALAAVLLHAAARFALKVFLYLRSPYSRDSGEGCILAMVQLLDERGTYFMDLRDYPYVHLNYPPVFPVLVWPLYRWLGPTLWVPRLLSSLSTLAIVAAVYGIARALGHARGWAAALAGLALCPWFVQTWGPLARVDMLAIALSTAGLLAYLRGARLGLVFALFWLAFFTKQNALLAPAAVLVSMALSGPRRRFLAALAGFVLPLAALSGLLVLATHGEAYRHLVTYTAAAGFDWSRLGEGYGSLARIAWPLLLVVAFTLARDAAVLFRGAAAPVVLYGLLTLAGLVTFAKEGAVQNYYVEPWIGTVLAAAAALPHFAKRAGAAPRVAVLILAAGVAHYTDNWAHLLPRAIANPERDAGFRRLWEVVRETDGPILSENMAVLVLNRKPVLVEPFGFLTLSRAHLLRTRPVVQDCENERFPVVVVEGLLESVPSLHECLQAHYRAAEELPPYRLLRPVRSTP
jgi:hypothetical protein